MESLEQTLRSVLQPLTHNLPPPIRNTATQLLGESCYRSLVHNVNLSDTVCLKLAISKALGYGIIGASAVVKIPQLLKLLNSQSAEGVSFLSYLLETSSYMISLAYNVRNQFPFSTYGETALISIQNVAISVLVLQYSGKGAAAAVFVAGLAGAGYAMYNDNITSMSTLQVLQMGAGVLSAASKLPQIITIFQEGGTGQLSAFAVSTHTHRAVGFQPANVYVCAAGLQLSPRLALPHLYYNPRSRRQAHTLQLHRGFRTKRRASRANDVLLEQSPEQKDASNKTRAERQRCDCADDGCANEEQE